MENYEIKGVSQASEIKKAYEEAVKANAPKYRAVSKTNQYYGWDEKANKHIKAEIGQEWFDNLHYVAPIEEVVKPIQEMVEVTNEIIEEVKVQETVEAVEEIDYKALYEEEKVKSQELITKNEELKKGFETLKNDLLLLKSKVTVFVNAFEELKNLLRGE